MNSAVAAPAALTLLGISKAFGRTVALSDVTLRVRQGTVHALLGENGAGKTTLMRIAFGLIAPDQGTITIAGAKQAITSAADAIDACVGMVHQHFTNVPEMTVAENVALGRRGTFDVGVARRRVVEIGERSGLQLDPRARAAELSVGGQQRLEIIKALGRGARTLILDEPTAVLAPAEAEELLRWLRRFADEGNSVVLITHKLHEALGIADEVTVLRLGRTVTNAKASDVTPQTLALALLGENQLPTVPRQPPRAGGPVVASANGAQILGEHGMIAVRDLNVEIRGGEIIGVAGVEGAGHRELLRALAGRSAVANGRLTLPSRVGFVPEDRHRDALVLQFSLAENLALAEAGVRRGRLPLRDMRHRTESLVREFDVRNAVATTRASALSGGNQQKFVLGRELSASPELLVVENPTRGLDIRASQAIHERLVLAAEAGAAVVVYSSDLDEVLTLATRVLVAHGGGVRECALDRESVGRAMLGLT